MNKKLLYTKDTAQIERVFEIFSWINIIANAIIALASLIVTIVIACDDEVLWLIPFGVLIVSIVTFLLIHSLLNVKFGMYYDIRKIRMKNEISSSYDTFDIDEIPEL